MVFTNKYTEALMDNFPNFRKSNSLKEAIELYNDGSDRINIYTVFSGLTWYVVEELIEKNPFITKEEIDIYNFIEEIRIKNINALEGTEELDYDNAACVCFLENLLNIASGGRIKYERFIPYLGEYSKEYCRAWDEFTGVKSPGLW